MIRPTRPVFAEVPLADLSFEVTYSPLPWVNHGSVFSVRPPRGSSPVTGFVGRWGSRAMRAPEPFGDIRTMWCSTPPSRSITPQSGSLQVGHAQPEGM